VTNCQQCQKQFTPTNERGPRPKFCSAACKQKHYRQTRNTRARAGKPSKAKKQRKPKIKTRNTRAQAGPARPPYDPQKEGWAELGPDGRYIAYLNGTAYHCPPGWYPTEGPGGLTLNRLPQGEGASDAS
jgi:hypothetical protein